MEVREENLSSSLVLDNGALENLLESIDYALLSTLSFPNMYGLSTYLVKGLSSTLNKYTPHFRKGKPFTLARKTLSFALEAGPISELNQTRRDVMTFTLPYPTTADANSEN